MPPFQFDPQVDVGSFLTFITLVAGFIWWLYTTIKEWRKRADDEARSGALRLLLRILREQKGVPISFTALFEKFKSPELKELRKTYCKRDWGFKNETDFEAAIYRLDWESKIDFVSPHEIIFRFDREQRTPNRFQPSEGDVNQIIAIFRDAIVNPDVDTWELEKLAESCMKIAPEPTAALLRDLLNSQDSQILLRVSSVIGKLLPEATV